jgi:hypothetical protein
LPLSPLIPHQRPTDAPGLKIEAIANLVYRPLVQVK